MHRLLQNRQVLSYVTGRGIYLDSVYRFKIGFFDDNEFSKFQNRLIFPVYDEFGTLVAYQGRALFDYKEAGSPKFYHNTYDKSAVLYGVFQDAERICNHNYVVLTEGPFDSISLSQIGIPSVAVMGSAVTQGQIEILSRYGDKVLVWTDGDKAGVQAYERAVELLALNGMKSGMIATQEKDANDFFLRYGTDATHKLVIGELRKFL